MTGAFIIEVSGEAVGLALPDHRGYRLVASIPLYKALDGVSFRTVAKAQRAAENLAHAQHYHRGARRNNRQRATLSPPSSPWTA